MTKPTEQHKAEAREIVARCEVDDHIAPNGRHYVTVAEETITKRIASTLASRDAEIRAVLEGLRTDVNCWCPEDLQDTGRITRHASTCLAAGKAWGEGARTANGVGLADDGQSDRTCRAVLNPCSTPKRSNRSNYLHLRQYFTACAIDIYILK